MGCRRVTGKMQIEKDDTVLDTLWQVSYQNKHSPDALAQHSQTVCFKSILTILIFLEGARPGKVALHYLIILFKCKQYVWIVFQRRNQGFIQQIIYAANFERSKEKIIYIIKINQFTEDGYRCQNSPNGNLKSKVWFKSFQYLRFCNKANYYIQIT